MRKFIAEEHALPVFGHERAVEPVFRIKVDHIDIVGVKTGDDRAAPFRFERQKSARRADIKEGLAGDGTWPV